MKTIDVTQGSPEWHAHRAKCWNASDAPAMMGVSPYKTRAEFLRECATGIVPEVDAATQRRFDDGHRFEALARTLAEEIVGEGLYPVTGVHDTLVIGGRPVAASLDGATVLENPILEHKSLNAELRTAFDQMQADPDGALIGNGALSPLYTIQMEQQLLVAGADRVLFMASSWSSDDTLIEERHCWYYPDLELRAKIIAGWKQLAADLAAWKPEDKPTTAVVVANPVEALPAVTVQVSGEIVVHENFHAFEVALRDFLDHRLIRTPKTDQDFADLDMQIKAMKGAEDALASAESQMLAQVQTIDAAKKTKDMLAKLVRDNRLMAEKLLTAEKDRRKLEIVQAGRDALATHIAALNERLGKPYMPTIAADFGLAIKGMRSLASMEAAVDALLANTKIAANEKADLIDRNLKYLREHAGEFKGLFADTSTIVLRAHDDLQNLVTARISEHKAEIERRAEAERERIRNEEQARAEREARERLAAEELSKRTASAEAARGHEIQDGSASARRNDPASLRGVPEPVANAGDARTASGGSAHSTVVQMRPAAPPADDGARMKLGEINTRIAPLAVTADGLADLGFKSVAVEKAAKLYRAADFPLIVDALIARLNAARDTAPMAA